jgi:hypothetical protein
MLAEKEMAGRKIPGSRLLSNAFFRKREAQTFPSAPSKDVWCGRLARILSSSPLQPGIPQAKAVGNTTQL